MLDQHARKNIAEVAEDFKFSGLSSSSNSLDGQIINTSLRQSLKDFAATCGFSYQQDHVGNIYIERSGLDKEQSAIALAFNLDSPDSGSPSLLSGALKTFLELENSKNTCPIALLGYSSPGGCALGRKFWAGHCSKPSAYEQVPELKQFERTIYPGPWDVAALVEIVHEKSPTVASGSALLTARIQPTAQRMVKIESSKNGYVGVPSVSIRGRDATAVGKEVVEKYSKYVAGLFENFD